jgi:hypothetical protein
VILPKSADWIDATRGRRAAFQSILTWIHRWKGGYKSMLQDEILDIERQRVAAMVNRDLAALDRMLAEDLTYTHSGGRTDTKASFLALIADTQSGYLGVDYSGEEVRACGAEGAIVRGIAQIRLIRAGGEQVSYPVLFLDVYARRDGRWQMVAWQATRAAE